MDTYADLMQLSPEEAKLVIQAQGKDVFIHPHDSVVTCDYWANRVRIFTDEFNKIYLITEG